MTEAKAKFRFAPLKGYEGPKEMGSDVLDFEGPIKILIVNGAPGKGKEPPHNPNIGWELRGDDEGCQGARLLKWTVYQGVSQKNNDLTYQTADVLASAEALTTEWINQAAEANHEMEPEEIVALARGKTAYVYVKASLDREGRPATDVDRFITREKYEELKATPGAFRKERPKLVPGQQKGAPVGPPIQNLGGAGAPKGLGPIAPPMGGAGAQQPAGGAPAQAQSFKLPSLPGLPQLPGR